MATGYAQVEEMDIALGDPLPWDVFNKAGMLLLKKGAVVNRQDQLDRLLNGGIYAVASELLETRQLAIGSAPVVLPSAWLRIAEARKAIEGAMAACRARTADFQERIAGLVTLVEEAVAISSNVAIACTTMKTEGPYTHRHPVDCAVVLDLLCQTAMLPDAVRRSLMSAALTMNVSQFETQEALNKVGGLLSNEQRSELQTHPALSTQWLSDAGVSDPIWLEAVARHHERFDGEGYPGKLKGAEIGEYAPLLALADWYCARLNARADRGVQVPAVAIKLAQQEARRTFAPNYPPLLAKALGTYPAGSFVKLSNGEISVVGKQTHNPDAPVVYTVKSPRGPLHNAIKRETDQDAHTVREGVNPALLNWDKPVKMADLWGKDAEGA